MIDIIYREVQLISVTQMQYVLAVARAGNFRRAAAACHVTQPTLSMQILKFEEEIGAEIFDRQLSPIQATRFGRPIIEQIKVAYAEVEKIMQLATHESQSVSGELRIGVIPTISPYLVPLFLQRLNERYPELSISLSDMKTELCLEALDREEIDVAILATREDSKKYQQDDLYEEEMLLYVHADHRFATQKRVHADDLEARDIWLLEDGHCLKDEIVKVCHLGREMRTRHGNLNIKVGSLEGVRALVERSFGYTLLPYLATLSLPKSKNALLRPLAEPIPKRKVNLTRRRRALDSAALQALRQEIMAGLPKDFAK
ncbi:MAG: LysR substrate-binding domain-containing protein [Bdellovibrionales bacterium]